jgi:hypothetical protein
MNERIQELVLKATGNNPSFDEFGIILGEEDIEKVAKLIIRECMTTVLKESKWYWDKDEFESANAIQNAARRVKEHFGVE